MKFVVKYVVFVVVSFLTIGLISSSF